MSLAQTVSTQSKGRNYYEERIAQHEAVAKLGRAETEVEGRRALTDLPKGAPKILEKALRDRDLKEAIQTQRRLMRYHKPVEQVTAKRLHREKVSLSQEIEVIREGAGLESSLRGAVDATFRALQRRSTIVSAYSTAIGELVDPGDFLGILDPKTLHGDEREALRYLGLPPGYYQRQYEYYATPGHFDFDGYREMARECAAGRSDAVLNRIHTSISKAPFTESPRHLVKNDVLVLGGDGIVAISAAATAWIAGAVCIYAESYVVGTAMLFMGGVALLMFADAT